jgi:hypothetical protein
MMTKSILAVCLAAISVMTSGCLGAGSRTTAVTFPAASDIGQTVRDLYQAAGKDSPVKAATATQPATLDPAEFTQAGYRIVFTECSQYFDSIVKTDNGLKMTKADVVAAGSAAAVIAALSKASAKTIGIVAAAFGFGVAVIDNFDQYSFATPYPTQTRGLILKALAAYRQSNSPETAKTISDASDLIAGYANLCTYSGIAELAAESISKATPTDVSKNGPLFTDAQKTALQPINTILALPAGTQLTDNDYVVLAAIADPTTDGNTALLDAIVATISSNIPPATVANKIYDTTASPHQKQAATLKSLWTMFSPLMSSNSQFATEVGNKEKSGSGSVPVKKPTVIGIQ